MKEKEKNLTESIIKHSTKMIQAKLALADLRRARFRVSMLVPPMLFPSSGHIAKLESEIHESIDSLQKIVAFMLKEIFRKYNINFKYNKYWLSSDDLKDAYLIHNSEGIKYVLFLKNYNKDPFTQINKGDVKEFEKVNHLLVDYSKINKIKIENITYLLTNKIR